MPLLLQVATDGINNEHFSPARFTFEEERRLVITVLSSVAVYTVYQVVEYQFLVNVHVLKVVFCVCQ